MADLKDPYLIESAARILDMLDLFRRSGENLTLADVAARLKLPTSTAFRLLYTLDRRGCVERIPGSRFYRARERQQIGLATTSSSIAFAAELTGGLRSAATRNEADVLLAQNGFDRKRTLANVRELLAAKVDLIMEIIPDASLGGSITELCRRAGVPLIALVFPLPGAISFAVDAHRAGVDGGAALGREVSRRWRGEVDSVILVNVPESGPVPFARLTGMLDGVRSCINVSREQIQSLVADRDTEQSQKSIYDLLANSCGRRTLLLAANDTLALAAARAAGHFGHDREILILSQGGDAPARQELQRRGTSLWGTVAHFPERFGEHVWPVAQRLLAGERVPSNNILQHAVLTSRNVSEYYSVVN